MNDLIKFPRTPHLEGSRLQRGDEDLESVPLADLHGRHLVVAEKLDGANAGISFDATGRLRLQSRGHVLAGGPRERHFDLFKSWAAGLQDRLWQRLGDRYVLYGEWLYAKHTVFYDRLPHFFLAFDALDRTAGAFLATAEREALLAGLPVESAPILAAGSFDRAADLTGLLARSRFKSGHWRASLQQAAAGRGLDVTLVLRQSDPSDLMEGLYIKAEAAGAVEARCKYVRADFLSQVAESGSHWQTRPIVPNGLASGVEIHRGG